MSLILKEHTDHVEKGQGTAFNVLYLSSYLGEIEIEVCDDCDFIRIRCTHAVNRWTDGETKLICDLCGADVT